VIPLIEDSRKFKEYCLKDLEADDDFEHIRESEDIHEEREVQIRTLEELNTADKLLDAFEIHEYSSIDESSLNNNLKESVIKPKSMDVVEPFVGDDDEE